MAPIQRDSPPFEKGYDEVIDVRSPSEFADDHFPGAINLPVLNDAERAEVGTLNAEEGGFSAKRRGATLITAAISKHLNEHFAEKPRDYRALIYCWRAGQRSQSLATILNAIGWKATLAERGYKGIRTYILEQLDLLPQQLKFTAINGLTGTGKTAVLHALREAGHQIIDLEGLANHRGSLLGAHPDSPQPSQRRFETLLWQALTELDPDKPVAIEAESRKIGNVQIPNALWESLTSCPLVRLDAPLEERVSLLLRDYEHFPNSPTLLTQRLEILRERYPTDVFTGWQRAIEAGDFRDFVRSILSTHYDRLYGSSGNYPAEVATLHLESLRDLDGNALAKSIWPNQ